MGSGAEPPAAYDFGDSKRKVLMPLKSTISCFGGVARELSLGKFRILIIQPPTSL